MNEEARKPTAEELERIAAHIDDGAALDGSHRKLAQQLRQDLTWLDAQLDVHVDDEVLLRINARLNEALHRRQQRRRWRIMLPASLAAAVALAAVLLSLVAWNPKPADSPQTASIAAIDSEAQEALGALDDDMLNLVARLATAQGDDLELQLPTSEGGEEEEGNAEPANALPVY